jgi:hypothetical protein
MTARHSDNDQPIEVDDNGHVTVIGPLELEPGDIVATPEEPLLANDERPIPVNLDYTAARMEHGARAIRAPQIPRDGRLTANQAHYFAIDLSRAADELKRIRTSLGYEQ